ncbi:hypothetical protein Hdeb2414_s0214g00835851 [Helianthus debilis subsp. tardiflorus]
MRKLQCFCILYCSNLTNYYTFFIINFVFAKQDVEIQDGVFLSSVEPKLISNV